MFMKDLEDIVDFANLVFNLKGEDIGDFEEFLPKAYSEAGAHRLMHHTIEEKGKIRALIDLYLFELRQEDCALKAAYVGTVSVHPKSRHKGYMTELMRRAQESAKSQKCDLMLLDGHRHRYRYYGFERAGIKYNYNITRDSIRHCCQNTHSCAGGVKKRCRFKLISEENADISGIIDKLYALYSRRNVTARAREDFLAVLKSWQACTYAVYYDERLSGYINLSSDERSIFEFEFADISVLPDVIYEFMDEFDSDELGVTVGADEQDKTERLDNMCDYFNVGLSHQVKILNYKNVLEFLLKWKSRYAKLADGDWIIRISQEKKNFMMSVHCGEVKVCETESAPDIAVDGMELVYMLTTPYFYQELQRRDSKIKNAPAGWLPLPFYLPEADAF